MLALAIATTTNPVTGIENGIEANVIATTMNPVTGTGNGIGNVTGIAGSGENVGTTGRGDIRPLTDAKTAGPSRTVSANHIAATKAGALH
jgi:hypothetical protein